MAKKILLIAHGKRSIKKRDAIIAQIRPILAMENIDIALHLTEYPRHAYEMAKELDLSEFFAVSGIGGDGTLNEIIDGMLNRPDNVIKPIAFFPGGTANDFLRCVDGLDPAQTANNIIQGRTRGIDILEIKTREKTYYSHLFMGWGLPYLLLKYALKFRWMGPLMYKIGAVLSFFTVRLRSVPVVIDGQHSQRKLLGFIACNAPMNGGGMKAAPHAKMDDGKLDIVFFGQGNIFQLIKAFSKMEDGSWLNLANVHYEQAVSIQLQSQDNNPLNIDGELCGSSPFKVKVLPQRIQFF